MKSTWSHAALVALVGGYLLSFPSVLAAEAFRESAVVVLEATEPVATGVSPAKDLARLAAWIGDADIVGLGETVHGTHTLHRLSHRIFQHLVEEEGFEIFALEIDQAHAAMLDEYVQGERDDLERLMAGSWWAQKIFYDAALEELLRWMRRYNETAQRRLHVAGFDLKQPVLAAERLAEWFRTADPKGAETLSDLLSRLWAPGAFGIYPNVWGYTGTARLTVPGPPTPDSSAATARIDMAVRGEGVSYGYVGFTARLGSSGPSTTRWIRIEELSRADARFSLHLDTAGADGILELTVFHRGNGTVWFEAPTLQWGDHGVSLPDSFLSMAARPLMMPILQRMDYRAEVIKNRSGGAATLRVSANPQLDISREAAASAQRLVEEILRSSESDVISHAEAHWAHQWTRLLVQAVDWRTLVEPNRDVYLAENLLWLHRTAFPGRRMLALAHTSHTERREGKMGAFVGESLGQGYQSVSMVADSGVYRSFDTKAGSTAELTAETPLGLQQIDSEEVLDLHASVSKLRPGNFLARVAELPRAMRSPPAASGTTSEPDVLVIVRNVTPALPSTTTASPPPVPPP